MSGFPRGGGLPITAEAGAADVVIDTDANNRQVRMTSTAADGTGSGRVLAAPELVELRAIDDSGAYESRFSCQADGDPGARAAAQLILGGAVAMTVNLQAAGNPQFGFYGHAAVSQAAHPVTLADVITALTNLGLVAP